MHEKLDHRINHADGIAEITKRGGRPLTREELRDFMNGKPLYPGEIQWTPIWVDDQTQKPDWMQIGEGEGDAGTSWLERSGGRYLSRHTDAWAKSSIDQDWNVTIVYWGRVFSKTLDSEEEKYGQIPFFNRNRLFWHSGGTLKNHCVLFDSTKEFKAERLEENLSWKFAKQTTEEFAIWVDSSSTECKFISWATEGETKVLEREPRLG